MSYMKPHFFMVVVGKPGSGKTTVVEKLVNETYKNKFDQILVVSPSVKKNKIEAKPDDKTDTFDLKWIHAKIRKMDQMQRARKAFGSKDLYIKKAMPSMGIW